MSERTISSISILRSCLLRETQVVRASRVAWSYGLICLVWGAAIPLLGLGRAGTAVWFLLPVLLYAIPPMALVSGVVAFHGDAGENDFLGTRLPGIWIRLLSKWITWTLLFGLATSLIIVPLLMVGASAARLLELWAYASGEIAIFLAAGLAVGRWFKDPLFALTGAMLSGFLMVAGGGLLGYVAAWQPLMQRLPDLWTFLLMAHPIEALRVGAVYSVENLPFEARELPLLASFWLQYAGWWYAALVLVWSASSLTLASLKRATPGH